MSYPPLRMALYDMVEKGIATAQSHIIFIVLGYLALRVVYLLRLHPLSNVPGPTIAALTDLWKTHAVSKKSFSTILHEQHAKYGDVVRIGPNEVSIIAPNDVRSVYGQNSGYTKGPFYDAWSIGGKGHFSNRDEVAHGLDRRAIAAAYSLNHLTSLEKYCDSCTDLLFRHLDKASESGSIVDLSKYIEWYAYDSVSRIGFGSDFGLLEKGDDTMGVLRTLAEATQAITIGATLTNFAWILPTKPVGWLISTTLGDKGPKLLIKHGTRPVKERQALRKGDPMTYEDGKDMLYRFMESTDPATGQPLDTPTLIKNCISIILAGADTTRSSMVAFLRYVYAHPPTLERLRKEMDDVIEDGNLSFPITYAQATRLEYMWACMKEAMRLHPAVGMPLQRVVPAGGRVIGGRFYHAGTLIGMSAQELHYDARAYGKDASQWCPERWLEGDRNELEKFNLGFGQGSRVCLGKNISLMEMSKLLPTILYRYDIGITNQEQSWKVCESWFQTQDDFFCSVTKRER